LALKKVCLGLGILVPLLLTGCFHATIETKLAPSDVVIANGWASCWILGLVPPSTVSTAAQCPNGVSKVETQRTFLNGLVGMLTLGIYTPMEIRVTCAGGGGAGLEDRTADIVIAENASAEQISEAFAKAAQMSAESGIPIYVKFAEVTTQTVPGA
jgi:hypothetical protein